MKLINDLPPQIYTLVAAYAKTIQFGAIANVSWQAVERESRGFNTDTEYTDYLRRTNFRKMCEEAERYVCHANMESRVEHDLNGITIRTAMIATSLTLFEKLLAEAFTAGRLYEKSDTLK